MFEKITYSKKWTEWRAKVSQCRKTERGTFWDFSTSILSQNIKKIQGDPLGKIFFRKKSLAVPKKMKGILTFWSRPVWYVTRKNRLVFWFSSLSQIVQFGAIIFCRDFKNYFGQFVWIEKKSHYNSRVSLHEAPTKNAGDKLCTFDSTELLLFSALFNFQEKV